jgi:hypothetical protein
MDLLWVLSLAAPMVVSMVYLLVDEMVLHLAALMVVMKGSLREQ